MRVRLFELGELIPPAPVPGRLRAARPGEVDLVQVWHEEFFAAVDEQAGRAAGVLPPERVDRATMIRRIDSRQIWFWVDDRDVPLHVTGCKPPSFGVARIGPVYTPKAFRGRGYASAAVASVSQRFVDDGARVCLTTDQANPTSNAIYARLGYRPVVDMVNLVLAPKEP